MKACGISLYRAALPILLASLVWSGLLFGLGETILGQANRRAATLNQEIRSGVPNTRTMDVLNRKWIVARDGSIYHYLFFEPELAEIGSLSVYEFGRRPGRLSKRTFARHAVFTNGWTGRDVWVRSFDPPDTDAPDDRHDDGEGIEISFAAASEQALPFLEPPDYFETERPDAELMT